MSKAESQDAAAVDDDGGGEGDKETVVKVSEYEKKNGVKVSEHQRKLNTAAEAKKREREGGGGGGGKDEGAEGGDTKKPALSMEEYLSMSLKSQKTTLVDSLVGSDEQKAALVNVDKASAKTREQENANLAGAAQTYQEIVLGYDEFLRDFDKEGQSANSEKAAISRNLRKKYYHAGGPMGPKALVPHLQGANLFELAAAVMKGKYKF